MAALCDYALKLTVTPAAMADDDLLPLRAEGLDDRAIVDANQVVSYFNYVNRVADGLGVELEESWPPEVRRRRHYSLARHALPEVAAASLPWLTLTEVRELDRLMVEELGIPLARMSENAGRELANLTRHVLGGDVAGRRVVVLAGPGGNGVGGLVAARHLGAAGAAVTVRVTWELDEAGGETAAELRALVAAGVAVARSARVPGADIVLDALLGYSLRGRPHGLVAELIAASHGQRVVALDVPSGLEVASATLHDPHAEAEATLTLAAPKAALREDAAKAVAGSLYLANIGVPPAVYARLGAPYTTPFSRGALVHVSA